jgi:pimeloyl-ACP methyl ester carboxylesterase
MTRLVPITGGASLAVIEEGAGPAVVLLHGWPVTAYHWRRLMPALAAAGYRAIAVEPRGLGGTSVGQGPFDKATLAAEVAELLEQMDVDAFALVGHDWGGTVGYLLAADHPERLRALVVEEEMLPGIEIAIPEPGRLHYPTWHGPFNRVPGLAEALVPGREDAYYGTFLRQSAGPDPLSRDALDAYLAAYRTPACLAAGLGYYRAVRADVESVARRASRPLDVPVLTLGGEFGMGGGVASSFTKVARHVTHVGIEGAGHYPAEQRPDRVNSSVIAFLDLQMAR